MSFGLVVSPRFIPDPGELRLLNPPFLRSILYSLDDLDRLKATGIPLLLTVNNEMAETGWWSTWDEAITAIADRADGQVIGVCVGNEFDLYNSRNPDDVPPQFAADLIKRAARILRPLGIKTVATSVAGPRWPEYLQQMADLCREDADWFDAHLYGQRPDGWGQRGWGHGDLRPTIAHAYEIARRPVILSEFGVKLVDAGDEAAVATFMAAAARTIDQLGTDVVPLTAWFAWHDAVGTAEEQGENAFGLRRADDSPRPAWTTFAALSYQTADSSNTAPADAPVVEPASPTPDLRAYARAAATRAGINPDRFERQINQESGFNQNAHNDGSGADGIAQIIPQWHPGVDTRDPIASLDYAARLLANYLVQFGSYVRALAAYNWGSGNVGGYTKLSGEVVPPWDGRRETLPAETQHYLDVILGPGWEAGSMPDAPVYDPDTPVTVQDHDWDCAQESTLWAMTAYGRHPSDAWMEASMLQRGVESTEDGLVIGNGSALAAWITEQYGEFGYAAYNVEHVDFDQVAAVAGGSPVLLGGHNWGGPNKGHWTGVRDMQGDTLRLANPGGSGPMYGQQSLTRDGFRRIGPCSMVVVTHASMPTGPTLPAPTPSRAAVLVAEIRERLNELEGLVA